VTNEPASGQELDGREPPARPRCPINANVDSVRRTGTRQVSTALSIGGTTDVNVESRGSHRYKLSTIRASMASRRPRATCRSCPA
jgi:hypothetical protein